jgi:diadenosine tetraphosphate (Ap4A) HIT family hydrolase
MNNCDLCNNIGGELLYQNELLRVVLVDEAHYPGFCRVIWQGHVKEMTDLTPPQRQALMHAVFAVEDCVQRVMQPDKINLASLGNMTPHVHWHVIPRYVDDAHFPQPVWGTQQRQPDSATLDEHRARLPALTQAIRAALATPNSAQAPQGNV